MNFDHHLPLPCVFLLAALAVGCGPEMPYNESIAEALPARVSFNYHIRPILSDRCFSCHGPDAAARKAELRLDEASFAYALRENGRPAIKPGKVRGSEVYHRIYSNDPELQMPPSLEEMDDFLQDDRSEAYEKVVEIKLAFRLLIGSWPNAPQLTELLALYRTEKQRFAADKPAAASNED